MQFRPPLPSQTRPSAMIAIPESATISPPPSAVRLMPSWQRQYPTDACAPGYTHDWHMTRGVGGLLICPHCLTAAWIWPMLSGRA